MTDRKFAAVFIDYENVYYSIKNSIPENVATTDFVEGMVRGARLHLQTQQHSEAVIVRAYADFEQIDDYAQGALYLMGVETCNVMGQDKKNAADIRLCIDVIETLYTRPQIDTFVIFAGDRDYIPLVQHLRRYGKTVLVAAIDATLSGDLAESVGKKNIIPADSLLIPAEKNRLIQARENLIKGVKEAPPPAVTKKEAEPVVAHVTAAGVEKVAPGKATKQTFEEFQAARSIPETKPFEKTETHLIADQSAKQVLRFIIKNFSQYSEIYLTPLLRSMSTAFPMMTDQERKSKLTWLESCGAVKLVRRPHMEFVGAHYTAVLINYNHKTVRELVEE